MKNNLSMMAFVMAAQFCGPLYADEAAMKLFFADKDNQAAFDVAVKSGKMALARQQFVNICQAAVAEKQGKGSGPQEAVASNGICSCYDNEIRKTSDREIFYQSVMAYRRYQQRVEAIRANDSERLEQLKKGYAAVDSYSKRIENRCGAI